MSGCTQAKLAPVQGSCYSLYRGDRFCIRRDDESEGHSVDTLVQILEHLGAGRTFISKELLMERASLGGLVDHETFTETHVYPGNIFKAATLVETLNVNIKLHVLRDSAEVLGACRLEAWCCGSRLGILGN